jgi:hypothetical protein
VRRAFGRHPVAAFLLIGIGVALVTTALPPPVDAVILTFDLAGVGLEAFPVTTATAVVPASLGFGAHAWVDRCAVVCRNTRATRRGPYVAARVSARCLMPSKHLRIMTGSANSISKLNKIVGFVHR